MAQAQPLQTYRPSGAIGPLALPLGILYGALAAGICGSVYQAIVEVLPLRWVSPLLTLLLGFFVGFFTGVGLRQGKLRNTPVAAVVLVAAGLAAVAVTFWTSYAYFLQPLVARHAGQVPDGMSLSQWLALKVELGWKVGSHPNKSPLHGPITYLVWAAEALTITGVAVGAGIYALDRPFCERTGTWMQGRALPVRTDGSAAQILAASATGDLATITHRRDHGSDTLTYTLFTGPDGQGPGYLTVAHVVTSTGKDGTESRRTTELVKLAALPDAELQQLTAWAAQAQVQTKAPAG